jgi:four helix bundle protein
VTSDEFKQGYIMNEERKVGGYKDLIVWQKSVALVKRVYQVTRTFPSDERFGLVSQMRRAAVSVPSNIAEGQARHTTGEFIHGISHGEGSLAELDTQLTIAIELGFCQPTVTTDLFALLSEIRKMLNALRRTLKDRS